MSYASFGRLLPPPLSVRRGIPFYYDKSEKEFADDVYERYDAYVNRQTALHLADQLHGGYPLQPLQDYIDTFLPQDETLRIADIGCSVGRLVGDIAVACPNWDCYGLDFSYQMLQQARRYWRLGQTLTPNLHRYGWSAPSLTGKHLPNLHLALARAEKLPFPDASLDVLFSTFLIDRLPTPFAAFTEWARVLKPGGRLIFVSPLNLLNSSSWRDAHPPVKILQRLQIAGWTLIDWTDPLDVREPMDARGNFVGWRCIAGVFQQN